MIEIYEVREAAASVGFYNCYKLKLVAANWAASSGDKFAYADAEPAFVSVMHVKEYGQSASAARALAVGDRMMVWDYSDCGGPARKIGTALTPEARMVKTTEGVLSAEDNFIRCDIVANDGSTAITSGLGHSIEVECTVSMNTFQADISDGKPKLETISTGGDYIFASWVAGVWGCVTLFGPGKECTPAEE